jgi:hypothetical protein
MTKADLRPHYAAPGRRTMLAALKEFLQGLLSVSPGAGG